MHRGGGKINNFMTEISLILIYFLGRKDRHNHLQPPSIQDPGLVLEQTEGHHRRQVRSVDIVVGRLEIA